jgi:glycosyltransferase involved in cell wall biosynthesis
MDLLPKHRKILVFAYRFFPEVGGYETLVREICKGLTSQNLDIVVACLTTRSDLPLEEHIDNFRVLRHRVTRSRAPRMSLARALYFKFIDRVIYCNAGFAKPISLLAQFLVMNDPYVPGLSADLSKWFLRVTLIEQPDIIHVFDARTAVILYPVATLTGVPVVVTFPGSFWARNRTERCYEKLCLSMGYGWYVMHEDGTGASSKARMMGVSHVSSFYSGVDASIFNPSRVSRIESRLELGLKEASFVIGMPGRIHERKGTREVIMSFLDSAKENSVLIIAGEIGNGNYYDGLVKLIRERGASAKVKFMGQIEHSRMPKFLAACDVIILNDLLSNFHLTFAETLMMGRPCIVRSAGMDQVKDKLGLCSTVILHDGTASALRAAIEKMRIPVSETDFVVEENALAREIFSWDAVVKEIDAAYRLVTN